MLQAEGNGCIFFLSTTQDKCEKEDRRSTNWAAFDPNNISQVRGHTKRIQICFKKNVTSTGNGCMCFFFHNLRQVREGKEDHRSTKCAPWTPITLVRYVDAQETCSKSASRRMLQAQGNGCIYIWPPLKTSARRKTVFLPNARRWNIFNCWSFCLKTKLARDDVKPITFVRYVTQETCSKSRFKKLCYKQESDVQVLLNYFLHYLYIL